MSSSGPILISEDYRKAQQELHQNLSYGMASVQYAPLVAEVLKLLEIEELLDYGAGKGRLGETLPQFVSHPLTIHHYDPAIPRWSRAPAPCRFVACIDVLEHIEPELIDNVLDDLQRLTLAAGLFTVHTGPAQKVLGDGRNAHLIQRPPSWWLPKFLSRFELVAFKRVEMGFWILVEKQRGQGGVDVSRHSGPAGLLGRVTSLLLRRGES